MSYTQRDDQHQTGEVSSESSRVARPPMPFLASALLPPLGGHGERPRSLWARLTGGVRCSVAGGVESDSPRAREGGIVRRRLVALTGPAQRRLRARVEQAARMQRLALASARSRSDRRASRGCGMPPLDEKRRPGRRTGRRSRKRLLGPRSAQLEQMFDC